MKDSQSNLEEKEAPGILEDDFFSRTDSSIFMLISSVLLDYSN